MPKKIHRVRCSVLSPLGPLQLGATESGLSHLYFPDHRRAQVLEGEEVESHPVLAHARRELAQYFAGELIRFETPLAPLAERGGTEFQHAVWEALLSIPLGETRSYGELARSIGRPNAVRAVGAANALNPISIFVPCHRVIGAGGSLTGYGGGLDAKRWLLQHEAPQRSYLLVSP